VWNEKIKLGCFFVHLSVFVKVFCSSGNCKQCCQQTEKTLQKELCFFWKPKKVERKSLHAFACLNINTLKAEKKKVRKASLISCCCFRQSMFGQNNSLFFFLSRTIVMLFQEKVQEGFVAKSFGHVDKKREGFFKEKKKKKQKAFL
jgi:hypothetical protein